MNEQVVEDEEDKIIVTIFLLDGTSVKMKLADAEEYVKANRHLIKPINVKHKRPMFED